MVKNLFYLILFLNFNVSAQQSVIRYNQLGYTPNGVKVAVFGSKSLNNVKTFKLVHAKTGDIVFTANTGKPFGTYGPFTQTYRLNFSAFKNYGIYFITCGNAKTDFFEISETVYNGAADFCLQYMRQQRSGFNPYLKDSCHTHDGYTLYGPMPDSTHIDVTGGWHDASDYLQYSTTSANATYHLLMAARDFPKVFTDSKLANGLDGKNNLPDVLDEAKWGLDWLLKMHPQEDWLFNQLGDDRDHVKMRIPKEDTNYYGRGLERPVYFASGKPQQRGKFMNNTTGVASTAGKFSSAFALGSELFYNINADYSKTLFQKSLTAYDLGIEKPGVCQTASVRSPYIYAEGNWEDDMELANAAIISAREKSKSSENLHSYNMDGLITGQHELVTPWLGADTANHYQWYPFVNVGHYEMAKLTKASPLQNQFLNYYKQGIEKVWNKAKTNAFYRGVPFIWCSNNLTTAFATQCYWYRTLSNNNNYQQLEQANFDWLFGCNPWGVSMVYGLPQKSNPWSTDAVNINTPNDPHSAFTHLKNYPVNGGLVDGPVYTSIYKSLIGIELHEPDEYTDWQSDLAVYHDDYGDYSTNEPTMDGTANLIYLLAAKEAEAKKIKAVKLNVTLENNIKQQFFKGAIIRGDTTKKQIALVFTGHEFNDGGSFVENTLQLQNIKASFFFTGDFYRNKNFTSTINNLKKQGHYLGAHSNKHVLYAPWSNQDSLLISKKEFNEDLLENYKAMKPFGLNKNTTPYFLPPYEWYNDTIASWTKEQKLQLINFTPGTLSTADYTWPQLPNYKSSDVIYNSIINKANAPNGLNGFILLVHIGTDEKRNDKFYKQLPSLVTDLKKMGYKFIKINELLK